MLCPVVLLKNRIEEDHLLFTVNSLPDGIGFQAEVRRDSRFSGARGRESPVDTSKRETL